MLDLLLRSSKDCSSAVLQLGGPGRPERVRNARLVLPATALSFAGGRRSIVIQVAEGVVLKVDDLRPGGPPVR